MSLHFPYRPFVVSAPLVSLGGRTIRPRPVISVTLIGPASTVLTNGLLDTGADDTVFPETLAVQLGIDLTNAPAGSGGGVGLQGFVVRYAEVTLRIADNQEQREWKAWVGFTSAPHRQALLGYAGFLQFFTTTFFGDLQEVELVVNSSYPGS